MLRDESISSSLKSPAVSLPATHDRRLHFNTEGRCWPHAANCVLPTVYFLGFVNECRAVSASRLLETSSTSDLLQHELRLLRLTFSQLMERSRSGNEVFKIANGTSSASAATHCASYFAEASRPLCASSCHPRSVTSSSPSRGFR